MPNQAPMDPDELDWPDPGHDNGGTQAIFNAKIDVRKKRIDAEIGRAKSEIDNDLAQSLEVQKGILEVAKASIDRKRAGAEMVQKAASAIAVIYSAALSIAFSVTDHPLPLRGILPGVFLGLAIVLATVYLAYLTTPASVTTLPDRLPPGVASQMFRAKWFVLWTGRAGMHRAYWLRAGVFSLGIALILLPLPFLASTEVSDVPSRGPGLEWPEPPLQGTDTKAREILYQAQVAEISKQRSRINFARNDNQDGAIISFGLLVGGLLVFAGPKVVERLSGLRELDKEAEPAVNPPQIQGTY